MLQGALDEKGVYIVVYITELLGEPIDHSIKYTESANKLLDDLVE